MTVNVNGTSYNVSFGPAGAAKVAPKAAGTGAGADVKAPVAGTVLKLVAAAGSDVKSGDVVMMIESMKMELEVKATADGTINFNVAAGDSIQAGQLVATIGGGAAAAPAPVAETSAASAPAATSGNGSAVNAPVAGTLLKNVLSEGAAVKSGDTIIMIESMKMELEVKATADGTVHYLANAGDSIQAGQAIAEIQ